MAGENNEIQTNNPLNEAASTETDSAWTLPQRWTLWLIVGFALVLRLLWLGSKPPHFDEGVNGWFIDQMAKESYYHYDPGNYHGPFHFYVLFLAQTLFGRSVEVMRLPLVLVNVATVWLLLQFRRFIPWRVCVIAALAFAVSPGMLFYSRYAIHEPWLVFGMILGTWGAAEMWTRGTVRGLLTAATGATLMVLTKETYIIHFVAFGLAIGTLALLEWLSPSATGISVRPVPQEWSWNTLGNVAAASLLAILFFYSGGFLDPTSLRGLLSTFSAWSQTGMDGTGHEKSWYYWLQLMLRYEWPALLGVFWSVRALWPGMNRLTRFLAIYGCGTLVAYSIVPYKTPWCIVSLLWPFFFLLGDAVDSAIRFLQKNGFSLIVAKLTALLGLGMLLVASLTASIYLNYLHPTDADDFPVKIPGLTAFFDEQALTDTPPDSRLQKILVHWQKMWTLPSYVYVQTTNDLFKLTGPLDKLTAQDPSALHMPANILLSSYHPLPWVLGRFTQVGYYDKESPQVMDAGFILAESDRIDKVEAQLKESYFVCPFRLRDGMTSGKLYFNTAQFASIFPGREPDFIPKTDNHTDEELPVMPAVPVEKAVSPAP